MGNRDNSVIYIGVTSNLEKRVIEHKAHEHKKSFTDQYNCEKLLYYEEYGSIYDAISREKQLKHWRRAWKYDLIRSVNSDFIDLSKEW